MGQIQENGAFGQHGWDGLRGLFSCCMILFDMTFGVIYSQGLALEWEIASPNA